MEVSDEGETLGRVSLRYTGRLGYHKVMPALFGRQTRTDLMYHSEPRIPARSWYSAPGMPYFLGYTGETAGFPEIQCFKTCDLVDKKLWCRGALASGGNRRGASHHDTREA